jgi:hypothetical protein
MEVEGGGERTGPYVAAVELKAAAEPIELELSARSRWVKPLSCYDRRETTVEEGPRYG